MKKSKLQLRFENKRLIKENDDILRGEVTKEMYDQFESAVEKRAFEIIIGRLNEIFGIDWDKTQESTLKVEKQTAIFNKNGLLTLMVYGQVALTIKKPTVYGEDGDVDVIVDFTEFDIETPQYFN